MARFTNMDAKQVSRAFTEALTGQKIPEQSYIEAGEERIRILQEKNPRSLQEEAELFELSAGIN